MTEIELLKALGNALQEMNWRAVDELCPRLVAHIRTQGAKPSNLLVQTLSSLRRKRCFNGMMQVAEAFIQSGAGTPFVKRQYAQALIDQGMLTAASAVLTPLAIEAAGTREGDEARGLLGRVYKQLFVAGGGTNVDALQRAITAYAAIYKENRARNIWHGINVVALLARATRDRFAVNCDLDAASTAEELLATIAAAEDDNFGSSDPWLTATALESLVALERYGDAEQRAIQYSSFGTADSFEIGSTLRQLEEIWQLNDSSDPGRSLLPLLRCALMQRDGASLLRDPRAIAQERANLAAAAAVTLEKRFGDTKSKTLRWYRDGLDRAAAIARIEQMGRGEGTGWLVRASDLFDAALPDLLLVTNAHVICDPKSPRAGAFAPDQVEANFQIAGHVTALDADVLWCNHDVDCTVLRIKTPPPNVPPLPVSRRKVEVWKPPQRMYVIGYPGGRDIEFSLQDNRLLDCDDSRLHYRTPTEGGNSGSPVFDEAWNVVGLHHGGDMRMQRIDNRDESYQANEAFAMTAVLEMTRQVRVT